MKPRLDNEISRVSGCCSDFEIGDFLGDIQVDGFSGVTTLDAKPSNPDAKAKRRELIESSRGGKHIELAVMATTFRQQKGKANRRYLRLGGDLAAQVGTFAGQPFLVDHNTREQESRKGTIRTATLVQETQSRVAFQMEFLAVKPDAVISILDGTLDRFSIGWFPETGAAVMCTVHGVDVTKADSCGCWPGDVVMVDGKSHVVEFEFTAWKGKELSGVNIPAVQHTNIQEVRAALAAEIQIYAIDQRPVNKENKMKFTRLAAILGLAALTDTDEDSAMAAVTSLQRRAETAEGRVATLQTELAQAKEALGAVTATAHEIQVNAMIESLGYQPGKLIRSRDSQDPAKTVASPRETRLRRIAKQDGIEALRAELAEMEVAIPIGGPSQASRVRQPAIAPLLGDRAPLNEENPYLASACNQLGVPLKDAVSLANRK